MAHPARGRFRWGFTHRPAGAGARPPQVLLAEDDAELRALLGEVLRGDGYDVVEARDGAEALDRIAGRRGRAGPRPPDVVVSDIRMPGKSGLELLGGLRREDSSLPVILITGFGDRKTLAQARRLGAAAVFEKPFDVDDLRTALVNLVDPPGLPPPRWAR